MPRLVIRAAGSPAFRSAVALVSAIALLATAVLPGCQGSKKSETAAAPRIGLVFDIGGIGDKSFNDSANEGLLQARRDLGVEIQAIEPAEGTDREAALRQMAAGGYGLVFGIGALFTDDMNAAAREFPDVRFVCVDYAVQEGMEVPPNLLGLKFREEEGAYLVGAIAGLVTKTNVVGFVGGMDNALIRKFESGYRQGVAAVNPACKVIANYAGVTAAAYKNPAKGKELAFAQYDQDADIIFHASGSTGLGVFEAARERDRLAIGVDADQQAEAPGHVLTSMLKRVDVAVFEAARDFVQGGFQGGVRQMGLAEGAIGYVYDDANKTWITEDVRAKVEELRQGILHGSIKVETQ